MTRVDFVEVYPRRKRKGPDLFDWRRIDGNNGQVIATSGGQGYADEDFCVEMAVRCNRDDTGQPLQVRRPNPKGGYEVLGDE